MIKGTSIVPTNVWLKDIHAKTAYGPLRGSQRFKILGEIDSAHAGKDAGELLDGKPIGIQVYATVTKSIARLPDKPKYCIIGVAVHGGKMPDFLRKKIIRSMQNGMSIVSGLHTFLNDDPEFNQVGIKSNVKLKDIRKPQPTSELRFWTGEIYSVKTPRIAMLGMDCVIGKHTTGKLLLELFRKTGIKAEMIYTGQTTWIEGLKNGFIFDTTVNDFISGEIERVIIECEQESSPDLILIEGQSSLRNPSGPCGSEFLISGNVKGVILQHAPGRQYFDGTNHPSSLIPPIEEEIEIIRLYGARPLAITLTEEGWEDPKMAEYQKELANKLSIPVVRPFKEGVIRLLPIIRKFIAEY